MPLVLVLLLLHCPRSTFPSSLPLLVCSERVPGCTLPLPLFLPHHTTFFTLLPPPHIHCPRLPHPVWITLPAYHSRHTTPRYMPLQALPSHSHAYLVLEFGVTCCYLGENLECPFLDYPLPAVLPLPPPRGLLWKVPIWTTLVGAWRFCTFITGLPHYIYLDYLQLIAPSLHTTHLPWIVPLFGSTIYIVVCCYIHSHLHTVTVAPHSSPFGLFPLDTLPTHWFIYLVWLQPPLPVPLDYSYSPTTLPHSWHYSLIIHWIILDSVLFFPCWFVWLVYILDSALFTPHLLPTLDVLLWIVTLLPWIPHLGLPFPFPFPGPTCVLVPLVVLGCAAVCHTTPATFPTHGFLFLWLYSSALLPSVYLGGYWTTTTPLYIPQLLWVLIPLLAYRLHLQQHTPPPLTPTTHIAPYRCYNIHILPYYTFPFCCMPWFLPWLVLPVLPLPHTFPCHYSLPGLLLFLVPSLVTTFPLLFTLPYLWFTLCI